MPGVWRRSPARWRGARLVTARPREPITKKAAGDFRPPPPRQLHPSRSAATCGSSRIRSNLPARPVHRPSGTRRRSTRRCTSHTCRCPPHSSRSSHTGDSRHFDCLRLQPRRARGPARPRERNWSWHIFLCIGKLNRSLHVTTCERGGSQRAHPIQFRQTPKRIRGGRIGTPRTIATYSRLTPRDCGTTGGAAGSPRATLPTLTDGRLALVTESG